MLKESEMKLCETLYEEFIRKVRLNEGDYNINQIKRIINANTWEILEDDMVRLCILDPLELNIGYNEIYYRINRIIYGSHDRDIVNFNKTLKTLGINVYVSYNYDIEEQVYRMYYYSELIETFYCPPEIWDIVISIRDCPLLAIREDKQKELNTLQVFLQSLTDYYNKRQKHKKKMIKRRLEIIRRNQAMSGG